jgi:hypothetical protein
MICIIGFANAKTKRERNVLQGPVQFVLGTSIRFVFCPRDNSLNASSWCTLEITRFSRLRYEQILSAKRVASEVSATRYQFGSFPCQMVTKSKGYDEDGSHSHVQSILIFTLTSDNQWTFFSFF